MDRAALKTQGIDIKGVQEQLESIDYKATTVPQIVDANRQYFKHENVKNMFLDPKKAQKLLDLRDKKVFTCIGSMVAEIAFFALKKKKLTIDSFASLR